MNLLKWEDLDLSLIKKGMITGGGLDGQDNYLTEVSFSEYINVWLGTVKHRDIFFNRSINNKLDKIEFEASSIRLGKDDFRDDFFYIVLYIGNDVLANTYYDIDILFDASNEDDYILPVLTDEQTMGGFANKIDVDQDTVDLIIECVQGERPPHYKIFTAEMLRAMYQIFTIYSVRSKDIEYNRGFGGNNILPIKENTLTRDVRETWFGVGSGNDTESIQNANSNAHDEYSSNYDKRTGANRDKPDSNGDNQLAYRRVSKQIVSKTALYDSVEGQSLVWSFKNRDDLFVSVDFAMYGILISNTKYVLDTNTGDFEFTGRFINKIPRMDNRLFFSEAGKPPPENIDIDSLKSSPELTNDGILTNFSISGVYPPSEMPIDSDFSEGGYDNPQNVGDVWVKSPDFVFANVNSFGFDYYAEPDLWPSA